jgi:transposase-like protein
MKTTTKYSPEFRERAVRMVFEHQGEHKTQWSAIGFWCKSDDYG